MPARRLFSVAAIALLALVVAGCTVQLRTDSRPRDACDDALASGRLVTDARSGLALATNGGDVTPILWPFGWSARREMSSVVLLDGTGKVVAREGDLVQVGGGLGSDGFFAVCPVGLTVTHPD